MPTNIRSKINGMDPARRQRIEKRAAALVAEEMSLREVRKAHGLAQQQIAETLGIGQEGVSRLEKRSDLLLSTLRNYIEAMGGRLSLVAEFPDRVPIVLSGLAALESDQQSKPPKPR